MSNVVVIDDSVVVRKIVEIILHRYGIACISYQDGYEALRAFKTGEDLMKTSPQFDHTTVVMLSARDGVLDRLKSRLAGAKGYITKPFKTQELLSIALSCLEHPSNNNARPARTEVEGHNRAIG